MTGPGITTFRVRYAETDQMGVVHHANYVIWCEQGRTDYMRELGVDYAELERSGLFLPVADLRIRYGASARYGEEIRVLTRIASVRSRAITFAYEIQRADTGQRLATATTMLVATDERGATCTLPPEIVSQFREVVDATAI